jgi:pyruvate ferredoxin oxidoreductase alpha subunit
MEELKGMEVSIAVAEAVKLADVDVVCAYPITPQTHVVEHLAELVADGELDAEFVPVESEHSAMSVSAGASAAGARTFTCTTSQGLALMSEIVYITASMRLPVVMTLMNRSLSSPLSIWNDHSDVMSIRDCGWIQTFVENGQEAFDMNIIAFRVAEDKNVLLPFIVNADGFILSHVIEPIRIMDKETVKRFLPPYAPKVRLHPDKPVTMGCFAMPNLFTEAKKAQQEAVKASMSTILKAFEEWGQLTGRYYHPIEKYKTEGAEVLFVTMGTFGETASVAVDELLKEGRSVGLVKIRLWRPFPFDDFRRAVARAKILVVLDRAISYGGPGGPVASELRSALYDEPAPPRVVNMVAGLGGRDVGVEDFKAMYYRSLDMAQQGVKEEDFQIYGVRE